MGINCTTKRIIDHSIQKHIAQKLNNAGVDIQAEMSITKHRTIEAYNIYRSQNKQQQIVITKLVVLLSMMKVNDHITDNQNNEGKKMINDKVNENKNDNR
ncbi:zinc finger mym-type protein 2-like [Gigaspora margarita]|uniref:Zinc finger mym-type protein 2-like n=1 Tax=Gigaspora margarita TaxID=4874 RepID=A0A8H4EIG8_GIGMA|nr:zinc finger mym-type protein 2-like [Gigaspora margarita]